ncbi:MAG: ferritin-like fold-containing protein, partial [Rhodoglobus sp.]
RSRSDDQVAIRVDLVEFTPPLTEFLGRAAYVQLMLFENLSRALSTAPSTAAKAAIGPAVELAISKHRALADEITRAGGSIATAMDPYTAEVDLFERSTQGADWYETLMTCYLTAGFLDDLFARLGAGLPAESSARIVAIYHSGTAEPMLGQQLQSAIEANPRLASRLAMWGRRLVGDTLLLARASLTWGENHRSDEERAEPVFTELIAAHTRRMDRLGLTA